MSKICFLITSEYPYKKGEAFLESEISYLSEAFDEVYIFSTKIYEETEKRYLPSNVKSFFVGENLNKIQYILRGLKYNQNLFPIKISRLGKLVVELYFRGKTACNIKKIMKIISNIGIDYNDYFCIYSYWFMNHAMVAAILKGYFNDNGYSVKAVSRAHGYDVYTERNILNYLPFRKELFELLDGVYSCSQNGLNYLNKKYKTHSKVKLARLGTEDYGVNQQQRNSQFHIVTCSSLIPLKRIDLFAKAFSIVCKEYNDVKWTCIGNGKEYKKIRNIIRLSGIENKVDFKGQLSNKEVIDFYKNNYVDLFCNVSTYEGVPVSIMEAQSFGIPVLATKVGGTEEIVNIKNGFFISPKINEKELAEEIIHIINLNNLSYKRIESRHDWEKKSNSKINYKNWCSNII